MKVLSVIGARPQFIKEAVVGEQLRALGMREILVHTGQHYDVNMSDVFFKYLKLKKPDYYLSVGSGTHAYQTGTTMIRLEEVVIKEKPDVLIVYGDTNATIAGALVGAKLKISVAHVEAGLRQEPKDMPEEINRVVTDHISRFLFCPTKRAVDNLKSEGISKGVYFVGDVMYDLFLKVKDSIDVQKVLKKYRLQRKNYILATVHRDFNTDNEERLRNILTALGEISREIPVVFPMHPRTKKVINQKNLWNLLGKTRVIDPVPYHELVALLTNSLKVITDSGGLQKEAYFAGVSAIVLMPDTGWIELVEANWNYLADTQKELIVQKALESSLNKCPFEQFYGQGDAGKKIAEIILRHQK
ncbi:MULTISPECIES: non-hydrolyzing UDP-N-acetylglucosamine 2-epimerase [Kosmotoga]|uniref:UDP-N-acetylglucosamine 2-epimerase n=1 Tax=Kosmotoga olearia (strain ATCC BAA-1733 / DSM 21960 / TBF 19.5.1) TaxID=521045 RepID=B5M6M1_KOSOT|nr:MULTISPECIES: UDP-N-acetylglucosamine 2-epimerase (non-hydrolyzing) [Kosmotoga]ACH68625.1 UDP-N-acetylglucosamine 2-epimerase [Kosmotoga olearia TBF 19.5.1]ACR80321.1 UDP-N-acetylglucosamine 2-epimerase [Kosmotoga olearia TBF 19.5.1]OAA20252.1 UDP-N-acetylglucosamine 2-epimerase [Kosmotoga sp. DU53]